LKAAQRRRNPKAVLVSPGSCHDNPDQQAYAEGNSHGLIRVFAHGLISRLGSRRRLILQAFTEVLCFFDYG